MRRARPPVLLYDGECGFCRRAAGFIAERLTEPAHVEPWQEVDIAGTGLTPADLAAAAWWIAADGTRRRGAAAIAAALAAGAGPWRFVGRAMEVPPLRWLAVGVYPLVARNRHRWRLPSQ